MALAFRSPVEEVIARLTSEEQSAVSAQAIKGLKLKELDLHDLFNYALNSKAKEKLITSGLYLSPLSYVPHSHPVCKTLENHFLFNVLPMYLNNDFYFVGIKSFKLNFVKARFPKLSMISTINRFVTSLDKSRYSNELVCLDSLSDASLLRHKGISESHALRNLLPEAIRLKARKLFLHDELHYWSVNDMIYFLEETKATTILATLVVPPETLLGATESMNRWAYSFKVRGNKLVFAPDSNWNESYIQPYAARQWLKIKRLQLSDGSTYDVDLVHSKYCHHLLSFTKGSLLNQDSRHFGDFEAINLGKLDPYTRKIRHCFPVDKNLVMKMYLYLRSLKKPDMESAEAKIRQMIDQPNGREVKFLEDFAKFVIECGPSRSVMHYSKVKRFVASMFPHCVGQFLSLYKQISLEDFIFDLENFNFSVDTIDADRSFIDKITFDSLVEEITEVNLPEMLDSKFSTGNLSFNCREEQPYMLGKNFWDFSDHRQSWRFEGMNMDSVLGHIFESSYASGWVEFDSNVRKQLLAIIKGGRVATKFEVLFGCYSISKKIEKEIRRRVLRVKEADKSHSIIGTFWFFDLRRKNQKFIEGDKAKLKLTEKAKEAYNNIILRYFGTDSINKFQPKLTPKNIVCAVLESDRRSISHKASKKENEDKEKHAEDEELSALSSNGEETTAEIEILVNEDSMGVEESEASCSKTEGLKVTPLLEVRKEVAATGLKSRAIQAPKMVFHKYESMLAKVLGSGRKSKILDFCNCFANSTYSVHKVSIDELSRDLRCLEMSLHDSCMIIRGGTGRIEEQPIISSPNCASILTFSSSCLAMVYREGFGEEEVNVEPYSIIKGFTQVKRLNNGGIVLILLQTDRMTKNKNEAHSGSCFYAGSSSMLNHCPIVMTKEFSILDFNCFSVPGDGNCFWHSIGYLLSSDGLERKQGLISALRADGDEIILSSIHEQACKDAYAEKEIIAAFCWRMKYRLVVITPDHEVCWTFGEKDWTFLGFLVLEDAHYQPLAPTNGCMIRAVASALGRRETDVLHHLCKPDTRYIFEDLCLGGGLNVSYLESMFEAFSIRASCDFGTHVDVINEKGSIPAIFVIEDGHIEHVPSKVLRSTNPKIDSLRIVQKNSFSVLEVNGSKIEYRANVDRAMLLQKSMIDGTTGSIGSEMFNGARAEDLEMCDGHMHKREILAIMGTFGCGKSWLYKQFIKASPGKSIVFVSPRRQLADSIRIDLGVGSREKLRDLGGVDVVTFEVFIKRIRALKKKHVVVIDEIQLFPPGYLDLVMTLADKSVQFVVAGDPCQAHYDSKSDRAIFEGVKLDVMELLDTKEYKYNIMSKRFRNPIFKGRLPCRFSEQFMKLELNNFELYENMKQMTHVYKDGLEVVLVSSFEEKKIVASYLGSNQKALTFGESTGMTFGVGAVLITYDSVRADENRWLTALSRFSDNVILVNEMGITLENLAALFNGRVLYNFLTAKSSERIIADMLPGKPKFIEDFVTRIGKDEGVAELKLVGDPWLKTSMFLGQQPDEELCEMQEFEGQVEDFKNHLTITDIEPVRARWAAKLALKENREFRVGLETTEQFIDSHLPFGEVLTNACEKYEAIYPKHKGTDSITFLMAVKKRLKFSRPDVESAKYRRAKAYGPYLLQTFLKHVKIDPRHNKTFMESAVSEFEEKKLSKSAATIENHSNRSCRDWLADTALIFMKSQHCTKFDNRFRDAKAGQTLACFHHSVLCRFAPYMRYIEKKVCSTLDSNFYIHSGKNIEQLDSWVKNHSFVGICTESDYEAFDASQDHYILAFEMELMKFLGLPVDLMEDYLYIKTHLGSKLGNFSIMRFTGEASTFLFNTLANMLFTFLRYDVRPGDCIAFAGDDMCANSRLRISNKNASFLDKLSLKAKVNYVENPTFCGWCLNKYGVYKRPQLVWERLCIARERKNTENCIDNYAIEVSYAYRLGEKLSEIMTEEEMDNQYLCVRSIVKNRYLLKSSIRDLFRNV